MKKKISSTSSSGRFVGGKGITYQKDYNYDSGPFWERQAHHMEDYEEKYAKALGIKIDEHGWSHGKRSGELDDSLRDYILERIERGKR